MPPHQFSNSHIITILRIMGTLAEFMICSWLVAIYNLSTVTQVFSSLWIHQWTFPYSWCGDSFGGELSCTSQVELFILMEACALLQLGHDLLCPLLSLVDPLTLAASHSSHISKKIIVLTNLAKSNTGWPVKMEFQIRIKTCVPDTTQNYSYWRTFIRDVNWHGHLVFYLSTYKISLKSLWRDWRRDRMHPRTRF